MKLILINGQSGTGKSTVADTLRNETVHSAFIDADFLVTVNPLSPDEELGLLLPNTLSLINNYVSHGFMTIFTAGLCKNQKYLNALLSKLDAETGVVFVWLRASKEVRKDRKVKRMNNIADKAEHFDVIDVMYPDVESFDVKGGIYKEIDTTDKTIQEVVEEIRTLFR